MSEAAHDTQGKQDRQPSHANDNTTIDDFVLTAKDRSDLHSLAQEVGKIGDNPAFGLLEARTLETAVELYKKHRDKEDGSLVMTTNIAHEYADRLWDVMSDVVGRKYLGFSAETLSELKASKDPSTGASNYDNFMQNIVGLKKEAIYDAFIGQKDNQFRGSSIPELVKDVYTVPLLAAKNRKIMSETPELEDHYKMNKFLQEEQDAGKLPGVELPQDPGNFQRLYQVFDAYSSYQKRIGEAKKAA